MLGLTNLERYVSVFVVTGEINESRCFSKEKERVKKIAANLSMDFGKKPVMKKKVIKNDETLRSPSGKRLITNNCNKDKLLKNMIKVTDQEKSLS